MEEEYIQQDPAIEINTRMRDLEEKQRLVKERILLVGKSLIEEREKNFREIQELKKTTFILKEENLRIKEILKNITEQLNLGARKEELLMLQRQFDMFRKN
ncbi:hypothetical protein COU54_04600 [Candidatus Pacearchaeota archaeon CG10_big_fil_rev_8_21_14_0_10_31_24]|nr:MAG: hypothetical protein COU54_04600 [Candidatus Pacearchaeota archaeon CG10_big_fil_rev_8_21_14_0_10_31_24]